MEQVNCDKCGGQTKPKQITAKKDGKQYTVYECQGNCMNGRFKYTCFAPKVPNTTTPAANNGNASMVLLRSIDETLKRIEKILANPNQSHIAQSEMEPDEEVPF